MNERESDGLPPAVRELLDEEGQRDDLRRIWDRLSDADEAREYDVDAEWAELAEQLDDQTDEGATDDAGRVESARTRPVSVPRPLAAAAVVALVLLGGVVWWAATPASVTAPPGEQVTVTLPDGSTARLNADSRISYPRGFLRLPWAGTDARLVRLSGEAYFTVAEQERTFRVETPNAAVEVLGTEFTVRSRAEDGDARRSVTEVVIASGRLRVEGRLAGDGAGAAVELDRPGERSRVVGDRGPTSPESVDLELATAWTRGGFSMTAAPVERVLRELERRFGTTIRLSDPAVAGDTVTLHYGSAVQAEDVLRDLAVIVGLKFRRTARGYELFRE